MPAGLVSPVESIMRALDRWRSGAGVEVVLSVTSGCGFASGITLVRPELASNTHVGVATPDTHIGSARP